MNSRIVDHQFIECFYIFGPVISYISYVYIFGKYVDYELRRLRFCCVLWQMNTEADPGMGPAGPYDS